MAGFSLYENNVNEGMPTIQQWLSSIWKKTIVKFGRLYIWELKCQIVMTQVYFKGTFEPNRKLEKAVKSHSNHTLPTWKYGKEVKDNVWYAWRKKEGVVTSGTLSITGLNKIYFATQEE